MSRTLTALFLLALVAASVLLAMAMFGTNPLASGKTFVVCAGIAAAMAVLVVGGYGLAYGPPQITISRRS